MVPARRRRHQPSPPAAAALASRTNPGSGTLSGTLSATASSGIATFSGLSINKAGTGYTLGAKGPKAVTDRQWVTAAASSIYSTPRDMARYLAALGTWAARILR